MAVPKKTMTWAEPSPLLIVPEVQLPSDHRHRSRITLRAKRSLKNTYETHSPSETTKKKNHFALHPSSQMSVLTHWKKAKLEKKY